MESTPWTWTGVYTRVAPHRHAILLYTSKALASRPVLVILSPTVCPKNIPDHATSFKVVC